jgi:hypothetical protein
MGIAAAYPTEYYWDVKNTNRFRGHQDVEDTKAVIEDLNRRYGTTAEQKAIEVTNYASNLDEEYVDSSPVNGVADAGNVQQRLYDSTDDFSYDNMFMILEPKK